MPTGTYEINDIPNEEEARRIEQGFRDRDGATSTSRQQQPDGRWTVKATFD